MVANFVWTGILYFSTLSIVFIVYRTFLNDRKAENEARTNAVIVSAQAKSREQAELSPNRPVDRRPRAIGNRLPAAR